MYVNVLYINGNMACQGKEIKGEKEGFWEYFNEDGTIYYSGRYINGKKTGTWVGISGKEYWKDGKRINQKKVTKVREILCDGCGVIKNDVKTITLKENGVVGYYNVERNYCGQCVRRHNQELLENWGQ